MMQINNLDKNMLGNIIIIVSILLVFLCFFLIMFSTQSEFVTWKGDGYTYMISSDMDYSISDDSFNVTSPYADNNFEFKKTTNQSNFNKYLKKSFEDNCYYTNRNGTHTLIVNEDDKFAVIIPSQSFKATTDGYELNGTTEIIEIHANNMNNLLSFINSAYR